LSEAAKPALALDCRWLDCRQASAPCVAAALPAVLALLAGSMLLPRTEAVGPCQEYIAQQKPDIGDYRFWVDEHSPSSSCTAKPPGSNKTYVMVFSDEFSTDVAPGGYK